MTLLSSYCTGDDFGHSVSGDWRVAVLCDGQEHYERISGRGVWAEEPTQYRHLGRCTCPVSEERTSTSEILAFFSARIRRWIGAGASLPSQRKTGRSK